MGFVVLPASIPDIRKVYDVYFAAFDGEVVTQILFPWNVHDDQFREGHASYTLEYWYKNRTQFTYKCVDTETDEIVGMSLWDVYWKERDESERSLPTVDWLQGEQRTRAQELIQAFWQRKEDVTKGRKHVCKFGPFDNDTHVLTWKTVMWLRCTRSISAEDSELF